jgi:cytochrome d ubiquinol oxidase subunit I
MAMWMLLLVAPVQAVIGDAHGLNTLQYQPAKIAAIEGHWENTPGKAVPLVLVGWPDMAQEKTLYAVEIPHLGSLILTHSWDGQFPGLKEFPPQDRPNSTIVFWTFRVMVGLGMLMILLGLWSAWARWRGRLYSSRPLLRFALCMGPAGVIAILAGWFTTEIGRQPWVVYGVMRTADAVSPHGATELGVTLALFVVVYLVVFGAGLVYMLRLIAAGPAPADAAAPSRGGPGQPRQPMRPLSAASDSGGSAASPAGH